MMNKINQYYRVLNVSQFREHNIWIHIDARFTPINHRFICILGNAFPADDECMGDGEKITSKPKLSEK